MDPVDVTVISCVYGDSHDQFIPRWLEAVEQLDPAPQEVIIGSDCPRKIAGVTVVNNDLLPGIWWYPQPCYLQQALWAASTEWVWIHDIDDLAFPDALEGLDDVDADVFQMGYERSDGEIYLPPILQASDVLASPYNPFVACSCVRTSVLRDVGGFPDVALQDWSLWRLLAHACATFSASDRPRFHYMRHPDTRGARELTFTNRDRHVREMLDWEADHAVAA